MSRLVIHCAPLFDDGSTGDGDELTVADDDHDRIGQWIARSLERHLGTRDGDATCDALDVTVSPDRAPDDPDGDRHCPVCREADPTRWPCERADCPPE